MQDPSIPAPAPRRRDRSRRGRAAPFDAFMPVWRSLGQAAHGIRDADWRGSPNALQAAIADSELVPMDTPDPAKLPRYVRDLPQVDGHVHDASCWVQPARGRLPGDAWGYLVEALWQVCRRADFPEAITALTVRLENRHLRPDAMTAWLWLSTAAQMDRTIIAGVENGPEVVAAVRDALRAMATGQAAAN